MADFKTVLETMGKGDMSVDDFSPQLKKLLEQSPQHAKGMLQKLDDAYANKVIDDAIYAKLKGQINQYRRAHATETETGGDGDGGDSTVFAQDDNFESEQDGGDYEATEVTGGGSVQDDSAAAFDVTGEDDGRLSEVDIDISNVGADTSTPTSATGPTGTEWSDPSVSTQQVGAELGPGSIIKQRFKLLEVLGVGGMGKVYKGLDLLKEEARDRQPYVAIKLLNEDFKDHPEAFISLQRESSRQQKLAHPNIATVYDFDRVGGPGTPVYITMELMEGMELKDFIKKKVRKQGGLPFEEAFEIVKQLVAALSYAHNRRLVHSDFKPGNAFLCNDGTVKTLDFGIARAVKNPVTGEAEKTLFDPGKLGALTPAYASFEMLEGEEPDTRDDIYALGCVAYELLTGKHPFNKLPANKAKENGLVPADIKGLKRRQNKALKKSVAYLRKDRYESVDDFLEDFEAKFIWYKNPFSVAAIILVVIAIGATGPVLNYFHQQEIDQIIVDINSGDANVITDRLAKITEFEKTDQLAITDEAKDAIQNYFKNKIGTLIDTANENYNFPKAEELLKEVANYYPDSSFLTEQKELWSNNKKQQLSLLYGEFSDALTAAREHNDPSKLGNTKNILDTIRLRVDPQNPLLTDPRPSNRYRILADNAFELGNFDEASNLVKSGLAIAPKDQTLLDSQKKISNKIEVIGLEQKIGSVQSQLTSLDDYKNIKTDVIRLAELEQGNTLLQPIANGMRDNISQALSSTSSRAEADALANEYGGMLSALQLGNELTQIKLAHLSGEERTKAIQDIVANDKAEIEKLMTTPNLEDAKWKSQMLANVQELDSLSSEDASIQQDLAGIRESTAKLYVAKANETLQENRFDAATSLIDSGAQFAPSLSDIFTTRNAIADARAAYEKKILVDGLKEELKTQTEANQVVAAIETLDKLKNEMPADDAFLTTEAPTMIAASYERLAKDRFEEKDFPNALKLADEGLKYNPGNALLTAARQEYVVEANIIDLTNLFKTENAFNVADVQRKIGEIAASPRFSGFRQDAITLLSDRINTLKTSDENAAATLAQNAAIIFPGTVLEKLKDEIKPQPWPNNNAATAALNAGKLTEVQGILETSAAEFSSHPDYVKIQSTLNQKIEQANTAYNLYLTEKEAAGTDYELLRNAKKQLTRAQAAWTDNPDFDTADDEISKLIADNSPTSKKVIQRETVDISAVATAEPGAVQKEWKPVSSGRECESRLAGYGKRSKAVCYDLVNDGWRGPLMVVVPTGGDIQKNFAISRYEISVGDYAKYCALSGNCKPVTDTEQQSEPLRNISLQEAEAYAQWLSERTGKTYRLPTSNEWIYAANAQGNEKMRKDFNCRVALGDKVIKGTGIVSVKTGVVNDWGLKNMIGNVQEWVKDGGEIKARGGAFQDAHSKCDVNLERAHNGGADETTGFRLILEEVG